MDRYRYDYNMCKYKKGRLKLLSYLPIFAYVLV